MEGRERFRQAFPTILLLSIFPHSQETVQLCIFGPHCEDGHSMVVEAAMKSH